jgi:hypothetical protein
MVLTMQKNALCRIPMGWADWMIVTKSLEEELQLERTIREIQSCDDKEILMQLCVAMTRQSFHQSKLLKQAVGHIASFDASIACSD